MIYIGSDHGGFDLKEKIKKWLAKWGYSFEDLGNMFYDKDDDYPDFAYRVAKKVVADEKNGNKFPASWKDRPKGILCCRSAAGMVIAANKVIGVRAVTVFSERSAQHSRMHNDANILAMSGSWLEEYQAQKILKIWLETEFSGEERHIRRINKIDEFEKIQFDS